MSPPWSQLEAGIQCTRGCGIGGISGIGGKWWHVWCSSNYWFTNYSSVTFPKGIVPTNSNKAWKRTMGLVNITSHLFICSLSWRWALVTFLQEVTTSYSLSYGLYGLVRAFIAKLSGKCPFEGRTHLHEQGRKKPYGPTRNTYCSMRCNFRGFRCF